MKPSGMLLLVPQCVSIRMCRLQHLRYIVGRTRHGTAGLWLDSLGTAVTGRPQGEPIEATGHDMVIEIKGATCTALCVGHTKRQCLAQTVLHV